MRCRTVLCVATAMGLAACGSSTAPGGISIGGHWSVAVANLSGGGHVCSGTFAANFAQSFNSFNGSYSNGSVMCVTNGVSTPIGQATGSVTDGKVDGQSISYTLNGDPITFTGTVNVSQMSGAVSWTKDFGDGNGPVTLAGSWTAQKQ